MTLSLKVLIFLKKLSNIFESNKFSSGFSVPLQFIIKNNIKERKNYIDIYEKEFRLHRAERLAKDLVILSSNGREELITLARIQFSLGYFSDAAEIYETLLEKFPMDPYVLLDYGKLARYSYERIGIEIDIFERAAQVSNGDVYVLEIVAQYFLFQLDYSRAANYYEQLFSICSQARSNPVACRNYAQSLIGCGREKESLAIISLGLERCRQISDSLNGSEKEMWLREEAQLLLLAGRENDSEIVLRTIKSLASENDFSREDYLPNTPARLDRLRKIIGSRDLLILLQGPSFSDFIPQSHKIADKDFVTATLGLFPPIESAIINETKKNIDILLITHPSIFRICFREIENFLRRPTINILITTRYAISALNDLNKDIDEFIRVFDERLLFVEPAGGPPLPSVPLHFEPGGSLALILPVVMLGLPRRIFLFGADGGSEKACDTKKPYFFYDTIDEVTSSNEFLKRAELINFQADDYKLAEANRRWRIDAINNDRIINLSMRHEEIIFDIQLPKIYNVCEHSNHQIFQKISYPEAVSLINENS